MKNNGFYLRSVGNNSWLLMSGDYPLAPSEKEKSYVYPVKLNETGAYIWERLDSGDTPEEAAAGLQARYHITYDEALEDVSALAQDFLAKGYMYE